MPVAMRPTQTMETTPAHKDVPRERACLRCAGTFWSHGFGERICKRCKGSKVWRNSPSMRPASPRHR